MSRLKVEFTKKNCLPTPKQGTFSDYPEGLKDMMNKAMHQMMFDQAKVLANTIQNCLTETLKKGAEGGYLGPAYFQPNRTLPVFQKTNRLPYRLTVQQ
jgi:hypothetical protein